MDKTRRGVRLDNLDEVLKDIEDLKESLKKMDTRKREFLLGVLKGAVLMSEASVEKKGA